LKKEREAAETEKEEEVDEEDEKTGVRRMR